MPLLARISTYADPRDNRAASRRTLRLQVSASAPATPDATDALVHNLSEEGLLLETAALLRVGDTLVVDLPEAGAIAAEVIWVREDFAGCAFDAPLPTAAVSAALLRSEPKQRSDAAASTLPAKQVDWDHEPSGYTEDGPLVRALTIGSLILGLVCAAIFIVALLSFPFSLNQ